ncbi:hypothetical protein DMENIID0001_105280 [Sergentomyia squamirostris]
MNILTLRRQELGGSDTHSPPGVQLPSPTPQYTGLSSCAHGLSHIGRQQTPGIFNLTHLQHLDYYMDPT